MAMTQSIASAARPALRTRRRDMGFMIVASAIFDNYFRRTQALARSARREFDNTHHCNSVSSLDDSVYGDRMKNVA